MLSFAWQMRHKLPYQLRRVHPCVRRPAVHHIAWCSPQILLPCSGAGGSPCSPEGISAWRQRLSRVASSRLDAAAGRLRRSCRVQREARDRAERAICLKCVRQCGRTSTRPCRGGGQTRAAVGASHARRAVDMGCISNNDRWVFEKLRCCPFDRTSAPWTEELFLPPCYSL